MKRAACLLAISLFEYRATDDQTFPVMFDYVTVGNPIKLSASPTTIGPSPLLGQHRQEVLRELGYSDADVEALAKDGAI